MDEQKKRPGYWLPLHKCFISHQCVDTDNWEAGKTTPWGCSSRTMEKKDTRGNLLTEVHLEKPLNGWENSANVFREMALLTLSSTAVK